MFAYLQKQPYYFFLLSLAACVALILGTVVSPWVLFIALLPILELDIQIKLTNLRHGYLIFLAYSFPALLIWNVGFVGFALSDQITPFWGSILLSSTFQCLGLILFRLTRDHINEAYGYFSLVLYWLSVEYIQLLFGFPEITLILGDAFSKTPFLIQWYELTGVLGGSLWVLSINIFLYLAIRSKFSIHRKVFGIYVVMIMGIAYVLSLFYEQKMDFFRTLVKEISISTSEIRNIKDCASQEIFRGGFLANHIKDFICVYKQNASIHADYLLDHAKLRAIENRCFALVLIDDSQTGLVSPSGELLDNIRRDSELKVWAKPGITFYAQQGDFLGRLAAFLATALFLTGLVKRKTGAKKGIKIP